MIQDIATGYDKITLDVAKVFGVATEGLTKLNINFEAGKLVKVSATYVTGVRLVEQFVSTVDAAKLAPVRPKR
jgi:hypothetical protein